MDSTLKDDEDVALKILHSADWHLGKSFPRFDEASRRKLSLARYDAVDRLLNLAHREQVDAVLCAGDLFDEPNPAREHYKALADLLTKHAHKERPIILLPGNHDPLTRTSVWSESHELRSLLPEGCIVVDRDDFELPIGDNGVIYARPCRSKAGQEDNALLLPARQDGDERIRIGMVHGSTFHVDGWQQNFPIAKDAAVRRGLDYLAIGDTHAFEIVPPDATVPTVYPSTPETTSFGESNTGFVALVLFTRRARRAIVQKERVARWTWRREVVRSMEALRQLAADDLSRTVLKLELELRVNADEYGEVERIVDELQGSEAAHGRVGVMLVDRESLVLDTKNIDEHFRELPSVLQASAQRLKALEAEQPERARRALYHLYRLTRELAP